MKKRQNTISYTMSRFLTTRPLVYLAGIVLLAGVSAWYALGLKINYNQMDLLPKDLASVQSTKEMISTLGGYGQLIVVLRSNDELHMKEVADGLTEKLALLPQVRSAQCKEDVSFFQKHLAYYMEYDDLKESYSLFRKTLRQVVRDSAAGKDVRKSYQNYIKPFEKLVEKYRHINNREVSDNYYIDRDRTMITIIVQANGDANDIAFNEELLADVQNVIGAYNRENKIKAVLKENYDKVPSEATVGYGFTGDYMRNLEDSLILRNALAPTSMVAFTGILLYLLILLRRPGQILFVMSTLMISIILTFGFARFAIGELNVITSVLAAILMGFGIDYGIHFIYRFREEYTYTRDLPSSIEKTLRHSGRASILSAFTAGSAMYVLAMADFKGFAHFGIIAGTGIIITALLMYTVLPAFYAAIARIYPGITKGLLMDIGKLEKKDKVDKPYPYAKRILSISVIITIILFIFTFRVSFDYDSRSFMSGNSPSVRLLNEIGKKFNMTGDPVAFYTETEEETRLRYEKLKGDSKTSAIKRNVFSLYSLVPPMKDQLKKQVILEQTKTRLDLLPGDMFSKKEKIFLGEIKKYLSAEPFTRKDVPEHLMAMFRPNKNSGKKGYITYVVPEKVLWDSRYVSTFAGSLREVDINGKKVYGAGGAIIYSDLALIVLRDGKIFPLLAAVIILVIILIGYRDYRALVFAMVPLIAGMIWMLGLMGITGWKVNFVNIVVFPVAFGYGISNGIHIYNRFLESRSIMYSLRHTGGAVIGSSITTLIGWGALLISNHNALISMGILAVFGISATLVVSFTVMPAAIQVGIKIKHAFREMG